MDSTTSFSTVWRNRSSATAAVIVVVVVSIFARQHLLDDRPSSDQKQLPDFSLDLNMASEAELNLLPGVGPKLARDIIEYRTEHGQFFSVNELQKIRGIKGGRLGSLEQFVFVSNASDNATTIHR